MRLPFAILALAAALAACDFSPQRTLSPDFGAAVRHNMTAQIVNPQAGSTAAASDLDGHRAGEAVERYRTGKVYHPTAPATSDLKTQQAR